MTAFRYMGRFMTVGDNIYPSVIEKLQKARNNLVRSSRILSREGADPKVLGNCFKVVTQAVLLFGAEIWVMTPRVERALSSIQYRNARRFNGRQPRIRGYDSW